LIRVIVAVLVILTIVFVFGAVTYSRLLSRAALVDDLQMENQILRDYTERVHKLERDLKTNRLLLRKMMELAGIDDAPYGASEDSAMMLGSAMGSYDPGASLQSSASDGATRNLAEQTTPDGIPMQGYLSRGYAPSESSGVRMHLGIDIAAKEGTPVYATASGKVEFAGWDEALGNLIIIDHMDEYKTHYGHNRAMLVSVGEKVNKGELIALSGNSGNSSAPHLHYEIRKNGEPIDPATLINLEDIGKVE
jgi:murein DD-endopeptidase MepM/ murein hydrolase activator NlpD